MPVRDHSDVARCVTATSGPNPLRRQDAQAVVIVLSPVIPSLERSLAFVVNFLRTPMTAPSPSLRRVRIEVALVAKSSVGQFLLAPGTWFAEQRDDVVRVFSDSAGQAHVGDLAVADFLGGLGRRDIVFILWG
jgi:hypothetical protein